ncbi:uncharacterized protein HLK63_K04169 [Nakaseomyces glabratus]|nr:Mitochondrial protein up-regulated during meiosis [Nakaseomyces glabratus]KTB17028.1 Uncharacterized protein AO442_003488 [Nakaseomyces glabratus]KTB26386.1 Uncharacterized protein AO443_003372 [Nakaseomyces glabratus]QNG15580.1 uncharacterized protein GWK60_K04191 [Nakaseomyces glabratus]UCS22215.1 uncharacterized protein GW608_K04169 [Nakaseomyces glabratus]
MLKRYHYARRIRLNHIRDLNQRRFIVSNYDDPNDVNYGQMTDYLREKGVPLLLQENLKEETLDDAIVLRLLPSTHPYIPNLHGILQYKTSMNAIRLIMRKFVLEENSRLKVLSSRRIRGDDDQIKYQCNISPYLTNHDKLLIRWQSCLPQTAGTVEPDEEDMNKTISFSSNDVLRTQTSSGESPILDYILQKPAKTISTLAPNVLSKHITLGNRISAMNNDDSLDNEYTRIVNGTFVFEFNEDNSKILVHTIENVELIDYERKINVPKNAFAC